MTSITLLLDHAEPSSRAFRAHAIKNCAAVICAVARLFEREVAITNHGHWKRLRTAAHRLRELLVEDLAEEMTGVTTRPCPEAEWCDVAVLVRAVSERVEARAAQAGAALTVLSDGGAILADGAALDEALFNLISNAIEATPCGGQVSLDTHQLANGDQRWLLRDTGHGISEDQLRQLGRPCASRKAGGSGIGFAIARSVVARHGGMLRIESSGPEGTAISILLAERADGRCSAQNATGRRRP